MENKTLQRHIATLWFTILIVSMSIICNAAPTKLVVLTQRGNNYPLLDAYLLEKFHQANPDIVVEMLDKSSDMNTLKVYLAAGQQVDIAVLNPLDVIDLGQQGLVANLDPYVKSEKRFSNWYPRSLDMFRAKGELWGLPRDLQLPGVFYNVDAFAQNGLQRPQSKWTYENVKSTAIKLQKKDENGNTVKWGWKFPTWRNWVPMIWGYGVDFYDNWVEPTKFTGNVPGMYDALHFLRSLVESEAILDKANHAKWGVQKAFASQTSAMVTTNTFVMGDFKTIKDFTWDIAPTPYGPEGRTPYFNGIGWMMFKSCQNKEAAWRFINFVTNENAMDAMIQILGVVPPDRRYQSRWLDNTTMPANKKIFFEDIEMAGYPGSLEKQLYTLVEQQVLAVLWGETPVTAAVETMEHLAKVRFEEIKNQ